MDNELKRLNSLAWDGEVEKGNWWTRPASHETIRRAKEGEVEITLTPCRRVPTSWCRRIGHRVLALASGGGQQGPILAASGRDVTVVDLSAAQLEQDRKTAAREDLALRTVRTSMDELDCFEDEAFDCVVNPVSVNFVPDCKEVFTQVRRILVKDGLFLFAVANPIMYIFDVKGLEKGRMRIRYTLPFSSDHSLSERQRRRMAERGDTFEFSHSLDSLIGGLCAAGFAIEDFYSDASGFEPVDSFVQDCYLAFLARAL